MKEEWKEDLWAVFLITLIAVSSFTVAFLLCLAFRMSIG